MKKHIPNLLTCCNLVCGCIGIEQVFEGNLVMSAYMIGLASVFDFLDGFSARLLKVSSPIGKELDSLADMVTFGLLPGMIMFKLLSELSSDKMLLYIAFLIPVFSALRLAKFNIDTRQSDSFLGLPTPANALFIGSLPLISEFAPEFEYLFLNEYILLGLTVVMSLLLVIEIPLIALKFKDYSFANNKIRYILIVVSISLIVFIKFIAIPVVIILYIIFSIIEKIAFSNK